MSNPMLPQYKTPPPIPKADSNSITVIGGLPKITSDQLQTIGGSSESDSFGWMLLALSALCGLGCSASIICSYLFEGVYLYPAALPLAVMSIFVGLMGSFAVKELKKDI